MSRISDLFFAHRSLIEQQINVYVAWTFRHHGWCLSTDEGWVRMFVKEEGIEDIEDARIHHLNHFLDLVRTNYPSDWAVKDAQTATMRFMRFYEARTKAFTMSPRRVPIVENDDLSTGDVKF